MNLQSFLEAFISWAMAQPDIEGVAMVGSYAREAATEDSDIDLMILTSERSRYLENHDWLTLFGEVEQSQKEIWGCVETVRATYKGFEIEYNFSGPSWAGVPVDSGTRCVVSGGIKILFDPKGKLDALRTTLLLESSALN